MGYDQEETLDEYIAELREIAAQVPEGAEAVIEFETEDSSTYRLIGYYRPPSPEEVAQREELNAEIRMAHEDAKLQGEAAERATYERLKAKFEGTRTRGGTAVPTDPLAAGSKNGG